MGSRNRTVLSLAFSFHQKRTRNGRNANMRVLYSLRLRIFIVESKTGGRCKDKKGRSTRESFNTTVLHHLEDQPIYSHDVAGLGRSCDTPFKPILRHSVCAQPWTCKGRIFSLAVLRLASKQCDSNPWLADVYEWTCHPFPECEICIMVAQHFVYIYFTCGFCWGIHRSFYITTSHCYVTRSTILVFHFVVSHCWSIVALKAVGWGRDVASPATVNSHRHYSLVCVVSTARTYYPPPIQHLHLLCTVFVAMFAVSDHTPLYPLSSIPLQGSCASGPSSACAGYYMCGTLDRCYGGLNGFSGLDINFSGKFCRCGRHAR